MRSENIVDHQSGIPDIDILLNIAVDPESYDEGVPTRYQIILNDQAGNREATAGLVFQNAPLGRATQNGLTDAAMLAVIKHRLQSIQKSSWSTPSNHMALDYVSLALDQLLEEVRHSANGNEPVPAAQAAVAIEDIENGNKPRKSRKPRKRKKG